MDDALVRKLQTLPIDLVPLGWTLMPAHLRTTEHAEERRYHVVYEHPFEPGIDDRHAGDRVGSGRFRVEARSLESWDDAYWQAVEAMRQIDIRREPE